MKTTYTILIATFAGLATWSSYRSWATTSHLRHLNSQNSITAPKRMNTESDQDLEHQIRKAIIEETSLSVKAQRVTIISRHGAVTLKGTVPTNFERYRIERLAAQALESQSNRQGVINNQIKVKYEPHHPGGST